MDEELARAIRTLCAHLGAELVGAPQPLDGGLTNRNVRVQVGEDDLVLRLPGRETGILGIDRRAERVATETAAAVGIGPEVVTFLEDGGCLVTRFIDGRHLEDGELRGPRVLGGVIAALHALHAAPPLPTTFSPFAIGRAYRAAAVERGAELPHAAHAAQAIAERIEPLMTGPDHEPVPCHNDLLGANFLLEGDAVRIVDWEYAGMGDRFFDLANLSVNNGFTPDDDARLLEAYFGGGGGGGATTRRRARLALMRLMSDDREAMWGVLQAAVSSLAFDFRAYADGHFARLLAAADEATLEHWLRDAAPGP